MHTPRCKECSQPITGPVGLILNEPRRFYSWFHEECSGVLREHYQRRLVPVRLRRLRHRVPIQVLGQRYGRPDGRARRREKAKQRGRAGRSIRTVVFP